MAISDELGMYAHPRPALPARNDGDVLAAVAALVREEGVTEVVVGLPLSLAGAMTEQTRKARAFADALAAGLPVRVTMQDERLTTAEAIRAHPRGRRRDGSLDSAAAAVMLQSLIDARRHGAAR